MWGVTSHHGASPPSASAAPPLASSGAVLSYSGSLASCECSAVPHTSMQAAPEYSVVRCGFRAHQEHHVTGRNVTAQTQTSEQQGNVLTLSGAESGSTRNSVKPTPAAT